MAKEIFLVPYSHLDTQWRWEFPTTIDKYLRSTLDESIRLFEKYPEHRFNFTGALRYSMMQEYFPQQFAQVKQYVAEGRWHLAGTCLDETDAIIPSAESMLRNILYGDRWAKKTFGRSSRDYMIPDCFGFPANMPTLMAHCGLHGFSSAKLKWGSAVGIPFEIGIWQGPDGSEMVSALNPCRYDDHLELPIPFNPGRLKRLKTLGQKSGIWKSFQYYGVGDIGGAPLEGSVKRALWSINHYRKKGGELTVRQGSSDEFFAAVTAEEKARMDRYQGEFLLVNHSAGVLTSAAIMKRWNRKNEQLAFAAEAAALQALQLAGKPYPTAKIEAAWQRVIGSQMHDILPGTSTPDAYDYSQNDELLALNSWRAILDDAAQALAPHVPGLGNILLFNPLPEARCDSVDLLLPLQTWHAISQQEEVWPRSVICADGSRLPAQCCLAEGDKLRITFRPPMASLSWARFELSTQPVSLPVSVPAPAAGADLIADQVSCEPYQGGYRLQNSALRVEVSATGQVAGIYDRRLGCQLLKSPLAYEFQRERPWDFPAWNMDWKDRRQPPYLRITTGKVTLLEQGPLRCRLAIRTAHGESQFVRELCLDAGAGQVDFIERIEWRESGCSLKLALQADLQSASFRPGDLQQSNLQQTQVTYNWETSRQSRGVNHEKCFEVPSRLWADISGPDRGISILEESKYGWDHPAEDILRLTLLYTPALWYIHGFWDQKSQDWGSHTIRYAIYSHPGDYQQTDARARAFNQPLRSFLLSDSVAAGDKCDGAGRGLINVSNPQLAVLAVKKAEDNDGMLVRLCERQGSAATARLTCHGTIARVDEVNGLEEVTGSLQPEGEQFTVTLKANSVRSFVVHLQPAEQADQAEPALTSLPLSLPYNCRLFSANGETGASSQSVAGSESSESRKSSESRHSSEVQLPLEQMPAQVEAGVVCYQLAAESDLNGLRCQGQSLAIPAGMSQLSLLLAANIACHGEFIFKDASGQLLASQRHPISAINGFIGQWDKRLWRKAPDHQQQRRREYAWLNRCVGIEPGWVNRERVEWYATHTHQDGQDLAYQYGYLWTLQLAVPPRATTVLLPDNPAIRIAAASVSADSRAEGSQVQSIQWLSDRFDF